MPAKDDRERELDREFAVLCFNWDGTAVPDRRADASALRSLVERLCALGVDVAVFSGTGVDNVDGQLRARPAAEGRLFLFLSRGSEVYVVGPGGPRLLERRVATAEENTRLDGAAGAVRARLAAAGVDTDVVNDRLNRRKVDLAPEWPGLRRADFAHLRRSVRRRLTDASLGDPGDVLALARFLARRVGLANPVVTIDGRYIEIGLTDKSDSMRQLRHSLVATRGRAASDVLVIGDEFGPAAAGDGVIGLRSPRSCRTQPLSRSGWSPTACRIR